jgi:hypothetical protein
MIRVDESVPRRTWGKKFDIPSSQHSMVVLQESDCLA